RRPGPPGPLAGWRVAVTGASGFCGGHVARAAADAGAEVLCLSRRPGPVGRHVPWDASRDRPDLAGADLVVHCAAEVGDAPAGSPAEARMVEVNVTGTERLLEAAGAASGTPPVLVWMSSASVYDPRPDRSRVTEDHPVASGHLNAYGRTKAAGERLALDAGAVVLRPRAVYGEGDPHLWPRLRSRVRAGRLLLPGPDVPLSLTAVGNLADACLAAREWPAGAYNVADAEPYRRDAAIRYVLAAHGVRARIHRVPLPVAGAAARLAEAVGRHRPDRAPELSRYAVDQLARPVVLEIGRALATGWRPRRGLTDETFGRTAAPPRAPGSARGRGR
ncbi:NAD-dependent epimerase/dehydratase family protein, partial [Streptomyces calidiresistens]|uniref:NAD-dependent epimerase/dehydratase family protein n=1 Tax=Streptomyces calidiresistens TaxID=1485586 RepID=UPI001888807C